MQKLTLYILFLAISGLGYTQKIENAIKKGDLDAIRKMEARGEDIYSEFNYTYYHEDTDEPGWDELYPMAYAAGVNDSSIVAFYIGKKAEMEEWGVWQATVSQAFVISLSTKNEALISSLYALGPDVNVLCNSCRAHNAIMVAVAYDLENWYFTLKPASDMHLYSDQGNSMLHLACLSSSRAIFEDVATSGLYDLNLMNDRSLTPLDVAARSNNAAYFFRLIELGADPLRTEQLWLSVAASGNMELLEFMIKNSRRQDMFRANEESDTPLHVAMMENHTDMALRLTDLMIEYCDSAGYEVINDYDFAYNDIHPLYWPINHGNKKVYAAFLRLAGKANKALEDHTYIPIYKSLYKPAVKAFGKDFVDEKYEENGIVVVK